MDDEKIYTDISKPLLHHKREVWYDDSQHINKLPTLAQILGFKKIKICGSKDNESDVAIVKTNNAGNGLIVENCHLEVQIWDNYEAASIKDTDGNKTYLKRGERNVL